MAADPLLIALAQASADCYVKFNPPTWQNPNKTCHVYQSMRLAKVTFAYEGTSDVMEWLEDFDAFAGQTAADHPVYGPLHLGYWRNIKAAVDNFMLPTLQALNFPPFYVTGHSKGAGEATETHAYMKWLGRPPLAVRAYEPPRVGGPMLQAYLAGTDHVWTQTWNAHGNDLVTDVPPEGPLHSQVGTVVRLPVPDSYGIAQKHEIPAVQAAIAAL